MGPKLHVGRVCFGTISSHRLVRGIRLTECLYSKAIQIPRHSHESAYFGLVLEGAYAETYGTRQRDCVRPLCSFILPTNCTPNGTRMSSCRSLNIELPLEWHTRVAEHASALQTPGYFRSGMLVRLARRLYGEFSNEDALSPLAIEGLTLEMLAAACRQPRRTMKLQPPIWLKHVKDLLHERCTENIPLETMAAGGGRSPGPSLPYLSRRHYHCTLGDYVRELRIEQAAAVSGRHRKTVVRNRASRGL